MRKSILLGCIAACALCATTVSAEVIKPTAEEVKTAFAEFLTTQNKIGTLFNLDQMQVTAVGDNFDITMPSAQHDQVQIPTQTIHLIYAGEFNNRAQYKIETPFENIQSLFKNILPNATFNTASADMTMIWVPSYNLVTKNSQNVKELKLSVPHMMDLSAASLVSDTLIQVVSPDKMDAADSSDGRDIQISAENVMIVVPSFSYESTLTGSNITSDPFEQMISCTLNTFKYAIPDVQLKMLEASAPIASFSIAGQGSYQNEVLHFENKIGDVSSPTLGAFVPAALLPAEISVNLDIEGVSKDVLSQLAKNAQTGTYTDEDVPALKTAIETGVFKINRVEAKNAMAGVALSGTVRLKLKDADSVKTVAEVQRNIEPVMEAKIVITNLDKISPEPTVDQERCNRATERLNAVDMSAPNATVQKDAAELQRQLACTPQGGSLDMIRPFLDKDNRVVNADGTTTDTLVVTFEDDVLTVNGKQFQ